MATKKKSKFQVTHSNKVKNANLYAEIVSAGGDKRVAAMAARKHTTMNPKEHPYYVNEVAARQWNPTTEKTRAEPKPKRARKGSPVRNRRPKKK